MKQQNMFTYVLYALIALLILFAGYKACEMQREKNRKAQEDAEFQETLKKLYPDSDTSAASGSSYVSRDSAGVKPSVSKTGIEEEPAKPSTTTTAPPKTTTKSSGSGVKGLGSGKWEVRAGTFSQMENARDRLEEVIRMGFPNAEIRKNPDGKAAVIVMRTNDKNKAIQIVDQLAKRGVDAAVFAR
jgi:hypothetical protein